MEKSNARKYYLSNIKGKRQRKYNYVYFVEDYKAFTTLPFSYDKGTCIVHVGTIKDGTWVAESGSIWKVPWKAKIYHN